MRIDSEAGTMTHYSYACVEVTTRASISLERLEAQFLAKGYFAYGSSRQMTASTRSEQTVLNVCRVVQTSSTVRSDERTVWAASQVVTTSTHTAMQTLPKVIFGELVRMNRHRHHPRSFQPVWDVARWTDAGLAIGVVDDADATEQLDALAEALAVERDLIAINPRTGWQGYGHPAVYEP